MAKKIKKETTESSELLDLFPSYTDGEMIKDNYKRALKLYHSLNIPDKYQLIPRIIAEEDTYNVLISIRAMAKTTDLLIWGLCLLRCYGVLPVYIRQTRYDIEPKTLHTLFDVVRDRQYGYIEKITGGRYNWVDYRAGEWHYQRLDEDLNVVEICPLPCMRCVSIDQNLKYKSTLNLPTSDLIIFDEFLNPRGYLQDEFISFCDLLKTIIRGEDKRSAKIYMLGNLVDRASIYFDELQLNDVLSDISYDEHRHLNCNDTTLHLYMLPRAHEQMQKLNLHYFGWNSPKLNSITAKSGMWAMSSYPRPPKGADFTILCKRFIVKNGKTIGLELRKYPDRSLIVCRSYAPYEIPDEAIYYIDSKASDPSHRFKFGWTKTDKIFETYYKLGLYTYIDNSVGTFVTSFYRDCEKVK